MNKKLERLHNAFKIAINDRELFELFLEDILTPTEYREILNRWEIIEQLHKGKHQLAIADDLAVGTATVTRGSRELADKNGGFYKVLQKLYKSK